MARLLRVFAELVAAVMIGNARHLVDSSAVTWHFVEQLWVEVPRGIG